MQLSETMVGKIAVIKVAEKRLDASVAMEFRQKMAEVIQHGHVSTVLNLSEVELIDSSGLAVIVSTLKQLNGRRDFVISGVKESVLLLFQLTRMDRVFRLFKDDEEAITSLSS